MLKKALIFISFCITILFTINFSSKAYTIASAGIVNTSGSSLNVRASYTTSSNKIYTLSNYSYVTILGEKNDFYYVEYKENKYGYVSKNYISIKSNDSRIVSTGSSSLNIRTGPGTSYDVFESASNNSTIVVLSSSNGWSRILFEGNKIGYASNIYLSNNKYNKINLDVVSYKQYDSRWAYNTIGNSNQTFKSIGCLVTSMSMSESFRNGSVITPLYFESISSFTESGALYWPSNYSFITSSSNYLEKIYNLLIEGKPVILGCKNSTSSHFVIITGYVGGNTLTASGFTINDPGSSTRTRLNEFLNSYPTFYKIAYYK